MRIALASLLLGLPLVGHAQQSCPYINAETTSGALQEQANLAVRRQTVDGDVCDFLAGTGKAKRRVYVLVKPNADLNRDLAKARKACTGEPQVADALGNEAWKCRTRGAPHAETIFGRVREVLFLVQVSGIPDDVVLQDKTSFVAEEVANNLY